MSSADAKSSDRGAGRTRALRASARGLAKVALEGTAALLRRAATASRAKAKDLYYREARLRVPADQRALAERVAGLKDCHRGEPMFLLGTGPSLHQVDLGPLGDHVTMAVNSFYRHPILERWHPTYFALMDWAWFVNGGELNPFFQQLRAALPNVTYFVPSMFVHEVRKYDWLPEDKTFYVPMDGDFSEGPWDDVDVRLLPSTPNAIMFALALAIHFGASPIVLVGIDHDWLAAPFTTEMNDTHFHPDPPWKLALSLIQNFFLDYEDTAQYCVRVWSAHANLRAIAERKGLRIVNVSPGTFLDTFETDTLANVVAKHPPAGRGPRPVPAESAGDHR